MSMSSGSSTSSMPTIEVTERLSSLTEPSTAMWLCASMMPGITKRPVASISVAPRGTSTLAPTAAILPLRITIVPFSIVPFVTVRMVALRIAVTGPVACANAGCDGTGAGRHQRGGKNEGADHRWSPWPGRPPGPRPAPGRRAWTRVGGHVETAAVHEHVLDAALVAEQVALHHDQVGDLAGLEAAEPVLHAVDLRGVQRERAQGRVGGETGLDGLAHVGEELGGRRQAVGVEGERHLLRGQRGRCPGRTVSDARARGAVRRRRGRRPWTSRATSR